MLLNFCEVFKKVALLRLWNLEFFLSFFLLVKYEMSKDLLKLILWNKQNYNCIYCIGELFSVGMSSVIYYVPVIFRLKQLFFLYFFNLDEGGKV